MAKKPNQNEFDREWKRLFGDLFQPRNEVEAEMSRRYVHWFLVFRQEAKHSDQTVTNHANGTSGASAHFENMVRAEGEMRRLWAQLQKSMKPREKSSGDDDYFNKTRK